MEVHYYCGNPQVLPEDSTVESVSLQYLEANTLRVCEVKRGPKGEAANLWH